MLDKLSKGFTSTTPIQVMRRLREGEANGC